MNVAIMKTETFLQKSQLSQNVKNAIYAVKASGALVDDDTIDLMIEVDAGQISDDEAIFKIMEDEKLA